ncbi:hypothetical protein DFJ58DRAFT_837785 [Suillus subalutaceus]|uniref:uncharacterized protein n=1 Tax=Suillus subalutaceus TaxID=48586 RepID=UPI001B87755B|nr:uncharacterized protein DFJ58DRAFT_837785 [Suillus subalutaceus]KAG1868947.1 hypothetical protein DFJ58DRAFT_837785 [Suillus subalutaceus]
MPVMEDQTLIGLWAKEEERVNRKTQKEKARILHQNTGTLVVQHMVARLLTILELKLRERGCCLHLRTLGKWIDGKIDGIDQIFAAIVKHQALAALKAKDYYFQSQFDPKAKLPARWHEGQEPRPYFWSAKHWNWVAKGNDLWTKPIDFLFHVLNEDPQYTVIEEFMQDLNALLNILTKEYD